jgi:hypothetical protein
MKDETIYMLIGLVLGLTGVIIIEHNSNIWVALGVFLMIWGDNLSGRPDK